MSAAEPDNAAENENQDKPVEIDQDEARCLRALRNGPLIEGALSLILSGLVKDPPFTARRLSRKKLVRKSKGAWSLTEAGEERAAQLHWDGERWT